MSPLGTNLGARYRKTRRTARTRDRADAGDGDTFRTLPVRRSMCVLSHSTPLVSGICSINVQGVNHLHIVCARGRRRYVSCIGVVCAGVCPGVSHQSHAPNAVTESARCDAERPAHRLRAHCACLVGARDSAVACRHPQTTATGTTLQSSEPSATQCAEHLHDARCMEAIQLGG